MKRIFAIIVLSILCTVSLNAQSFFSSAEGSTTTISPESQVEAGAATFATTAHNFGTVKAGEALSFTFDLENTGEGSLTIENVKPSCSCTVPEYSKEAIEAGEAGYVKALFTPKRPGVFTKTVSVHFNNGDAPIVLTIKGIAE